jgi:ubiquinone/menaquinone biosynthesis C-methylase UbiE
MSKSQSRLGPDGYRLAQGAPCFVVTRSVDKRSTFITDCLKTSKNQNILEIGCGCGVYLPLLSTYAATLTAVDINESYLAEAGKQGSNAILKNMSAESLEFSDRSFDVVVMIETLEHIPDDQKALREISRVLKPGGKLIITAPNKRFPFETHGLRIGRIQLRFPATVLLPFSPAYPMRLRRLMANARVYSYPYLKKILLSYGLVARESRFLMPSLDSADNRYGLVTKFLAKVARSGFDLIEKSPISIFGTTIIICAEKL